MSEIEKMYEKVGIKFIIGICCRAKTGDGCKSRCSVCDYNTKPKEYPPFTPEKQLELIKWLINFDYTHLSKLYGADINFSVVLAATINYLWKCLSKSEQEQIRSILNG